MSPSAGWSVGRSVGPPRIVHWSLFTSFFVNKRILVSHSPLSKTRHSSFSTVDVLPCGAYSSCLCRAHASGETWRKLVLITNCCVCFTTSMPLGALLGVALRSVVLVLFMFLFYSLLGEIYF